MAGTDPTESGAQQQAIDRSLHLDRQAVVQAVSPTGGGGSDGDGGDGGSTADGGPETTVDIRWTENDPGATDVFDVPVAPSILRESVPLSQGDPVIVRWLAGDPPQPYVADSFYNEADHEPRAAGDAYVLEHGGTRIELGADGDVSIDAAGELSLTNSEGAGVTTDAGSTSVPGYTASGGTGTPGELPDTDPSGTPEERATQAGFDIQNTVQVTSTSDFGSQSNTLYVADGTVTWDGPIEVSGVSETAYCGQNDAVIPIPADYREYAAIVGSGNGFMWSGIDLDQTATGAAAALSVQVDDRGFLEYFQTVGSGRRRDADPDVDESTSDDPEAGIFLNPPSTSSGGTTRIKNVASVHSGMFYNVHGYGGWTGIFAAQPHRGTLNIVNSTLDSFGGNGLYATNTSGTVHVRDTEFIDNGVSAARIARGSYENCLVQFDYTDSNLQNADTDTHATEGLAVEQDVSGGSVDMTGCTVEMLNVALCGGCFDVRSGTAGTVSGCTFRSDNTNGAPSIIVDGSIEEISNNTFTGSESSGTCIVNRGPTATIESNTFDIADGRSRITGN